MSIAANLNAIKSTLPPHVTLVAVSKTHPVDAIMEAYISGHRFFGENKVQELIQKAGQLPCDIQWHMIGHLQTNKIKSIVPFVALIHGIDSLKLLMTVEKEASKIGREVDCLLQVHVAEEETKFGFSPKELAFVITKEVLDELKFVRLRGLMGMATFTDNQAQIAREFSALKQLFDHFKANVMDDNGKFDTLSMGMSDDYLLAVGHGSTMVRIGSSIFGDRSFPSKV
ncbi:MAG: YggS family pyridoxal phosphate-dependent enzyme [Breznakibacter sp.]